MPRSLLVGILVFGLFLNGCAAPSHVAQTADTPGEAAVRNPFPPESTHPVRDWCKAHPVIVGMATGLLVVGGALLVKGALFAVAVGSSH